MAPPSIGLPKLILFLASSSLPPPPIYIQSLNLMNLPCDYILNLLSSSIFITMLQAMFISWLCYCHSLLTSLPPSVSPFPVVFTLFQVILKHKSECVTVLFKTLPWLSLPFKIKSKFFKVFVAPFIIWPVLHDSAIQSHLRFLQTCAGGEHLQISTPGILSVWLTPSCHSSQLGLSSRNLH